MGRPIIFRGLRHVTVMEGRRTFIILFVVMILPIPGGAMKGVGWYRWKGVWMMVVVYIKWKAEKDGTADLFSNFKMINERLGT